MAAERDPKQNASNAVVDDDEPDDCVSSALDVPMEEFKQCWKKQGNDRRTDQKNI
ncbi:unnamed protein product [Aureobasidium pullulans]|nr:unnamed protein product [Aureobasidium pullulans]